MLNCVVHNLVVTKYRHVHISKTYMYRNSKKYQL